MTTRRALRQQLESGRLRRYFDAAHDAWHVQLVQGDCYVSSAADEVLTTVLGSCISACIRDPIERVAGMNHFLLPDGAAGDLTRTEFGVNSMEVLINGLIKAGAVRHRLEAKIFGGANVLNGLSDIGSKNAEFAERFLASEGFPIVGKDVGGRRPRRIAFWPTTGRVRLLAISCNTIELAGQELQASRSQIAQRNTGDVELF